MFCKAWLSKIPISCSPGGIEFRTYQRIFGRVLVECSYSCPVVVSENGEPGRIELILARYDTIEMRKTLLGEHGMSIGVRELDQIPVASGLGYLIRDGTTGTAEEDELFGAQMNHVEKSFETNSGIAL